MQIDEGRVSIAAAFLDGKDHAIHKVTRAGFTTSFVIAASRSNKRVLLVSPTRKIISDTMNDAADGLVGIYGNAACQYNQDEIAKEPLLAQLPMSIPKKCDNCKYADECCILDIERDPNAPMKSLTLAKLEAIMLSDSERAQDLRENLKDTDVVLFDEAHTLVTTDVAQVPKTAHLHYLRPKISAYPLLLQVQWKWTQLRGSIENEADDLWAQVEQDPDNWLVREVKVPWTLTGDEQLKVWGELRKLAKAHEDLGVTGEEVLQLRDIIEILSHDTARLSYIGGSSGYDESGQKIQGSGQILVCGALGRMNGAIKDYLKNCAQDASAIFVSGTLFEPHPGFFAAIAGRDKFLNDVDLPLEQATFPDFNNTNSKMTIYTDSSRLSGNNRQKHARIPDIIERIKEISEAKGNVLIHVLAPNIELYARLQKALFKEYPNLFWDYYRSANTIGVESDRRIIIAIGLAEVPKNAYDCLADSYTESQTIRIGSVDAATWQAWSRAKDPRGVVQSEVHCIGVKAEDADRVLTWGPGRKIKKIDAHRYGVVCEGELPKPEIRVPYKKQVNARLRKAEPYLKKIWDAEGDLNGCPIPVYELKSQPLKTLKPRIYYIRDFNEKHVADSSNSEKVKCFGAIYSHPADAAQLKITIETLDQFFRSKKEQHAEQMKQPDGKGKHGYRPHITQDWSMLVYDMLYNGRTLATYGIGEDGLTVQCSLDIDNHEGTNAARPRVLAAKSHVEGLGAQAIIVASGSADSYHVHIPVLRTPVGTSHEFLKTVLNELKQGRKDLDWHSTETFPKQSNKDRVYGNALKLPLAINNKTGRRAEILGDDLEAADVTFITKVIELQEPEKEAEKFGKRMFLPAKLPSHRSSDYNRGSMRPCVVAALETQLEGGEGHDMRIAIVCEALASGKTRDEIIEMFKTQNDYDEATTANNVDYIIRRGYHPWKCETIRDRCSSFVDCSQCPHNADKAEIVGSQSIFEEPIEAIFAR